VVSKTRTVRTDGEHFRRRGAPRPPATPPRTSNPTPGSSNAGNKTPSPHNLSVPQVTPMPASLKLSCPLPLQPQARALHRAMLLRSWKSESCRRMGGGVPLGERSRVGRAQFWGTPG